MGYDFELKKATVREQNLIIQNNRLKSVVSDLTYELKKAKRRDG